MIVKETWSWREGPLLAIALREVDEGRHVDFESMADETGIPLRQVCVAMRALRDARYVDGWFAAGDAGHVSAVSATARERLGSWPSAEAALDRLIAALSEAAGNESDPERKGKLRELAEGLGGVAYKVGVDALGAFFRHEIGLP